MQKVTFVILHRGFVISYIVSNNDVFTDTIICIRIISEDSTQRFRRSLLATSTFNRTSVTLEFGNPPAPNITMTDPPSVAEEIEMAREINDSVDLEVHSNSVHTLTVLNLTDVQENTIPDVPLNGSNPLNVDPPETMDFVQNFNASAIGYVEEVIDYQELLQEVEDTNTIGEELINLVRLIICTNV